MRVLGSRSTRGDGVGRERTEGPRFNPWPFFPQSDNGQSGKPPLHRVGVVFVVVEGEEEHLAHGQLAELRMRQTIRVERGFGPSFDGTRKSRDLR